MTETKRKNLKKTPWYTTKIDGNPLMSRPGPYQCECCKRFFYWDGRQWWDGDDTATVFVWRGIER